jgi:competence protein ComEC
MNLLKKYRSVIGMTLLVGGYALYTFFHQLYIPPGHLKITMLNIGQGDAILIQIGETHFRTIDILVDSGPDHSVVYELGDTLAPWNNTIEYAIATHDDADHIAGFLEMKKQYEITQWILPGRTKDTAVSEYFHDFLNESGAAQQRVRRGDTLQITPDAQFHILHPTAVPHEDINDDSIVGIFRFKNVHTMLTGDASVKNEQDILADPQFAQMNFDVDILKAGHHGSKTSTSLEWLQATQPETVLISAGVDNTFGHPHYRVIKDIQESGATVFQTNRDGRTACISDGLDYKCAPVRSSAFQALSAFGLAPK